MILYGHRGAAGEAPENTIEGFRYAESIGVRAFELDVRLSKDRELIVMHDDSPQRTAGAPGKVWEYTTAELAAMDARAQHTSWPVATPVPTLAEVLRTFPQVDYQIEIKTAPLEDLPLICRGIAALVAEYGLGQKVEISSFQPAALETMREVAPSLPRAYIGVYDRAEFVERAVELEARSACIPHKTAPIEVVDLAKRSGLRIDGWQGNSDADLELLLGWQCDAITSDYPTLALRYLKAKRAI